MASSSSPIYLKQPQNTRKITSSTGSHHYGQLILQTPPGTHGQGCLRFFELAHNADQSRLVVKDEMQFTDEMTSMNHKKKTYSKPGPGIPQDWLGLIVNFTSRIDLLISIGLVLPVTQWNNVAHHYR